MYIVGSSFVFRISRLAEASRIAHGNGTTECVELRRIGKRRW